MKNVSRRIYPHRVQINGTGYMDASTGSSRPPRYVLVFDCESDSAFADLPGEFHEDKIKFMQFTVICALAMPADMIEANAPVDEILAHSTRHSWWRDVSEQGSNPIITLLKLFDEAELIVGFNCLGFDFPLIRRFYRPSETVLYPNQRYVDHRSKTLDIMFRVKEATGNYFKLDELLKKNGLETKSSNGMEAIKMWADGRRDELKSYCEKDVLVTAKLALLDSMKFSDHLKITSKVFGIKRELSLHTQSPEMDTDGGFVVI